jgi:signal peptidase I
MEWKPKPWLAALLGFFMHPIGMLYVQRPSWALVYLCAGSGIAIAVVLLGRLGSEAASFVSDFAGLAIAITCAMHAYHIATLTLPAGQRAWYSRWYALTSFAVIPMLALVTVRSFFCEPFAVPSEPMYPSIPGGSFVVADKRGFGHYGTYGFEGFRTRSIAPIARGDVIVYRLAEYPQTTFLSRIVAIPGDHIEYRDRRMTLNGEPASLRFESRDGIYQLATESIGGRETRVAFIAERMGGDYEAIVPEDQFVVFGDNRDNARDSRYIGPVSRDAIIGRVVKVF